MEFLFGDDENVLGLGVLVVAESMNILQTIDAQTLQGSTVRYMDYTSMTQLHIKKQMDF